MDIRNATSYESIAYFVRAAVSLPKQRGVATQQLSCSPRSPLSPQSIDRGQRALWASRSDTLEKRVIAAKAATTCLLLIADH